MLPDDPFDLLLPDPLAALAEEHARALDAECAIYLALHGDAMRAEMLAATEVPDAA